MLLSSPSSTPTPWIVIVGGQHCTWPQCVSLCVKIATSNPVILMFDRHKWVHRRLSSSKGYDVQQWLLIHRKQQHWDTRGMNLSLPRMPVIVEPTTMLVVHTIINMMSLFGGRRRGFRIRLTLLLAHLCAHPGQQPASLDSPKIAFWFPQKNASSMLH